MPGLTCASLEAKGLAEDGHETEAGLALRQRIEDDTDRLTTVPWELLGCDGAERFATDLEPPCGLLLARVDVAAGPTTSRAHAFR